MKGIHNIKAGVTYEDTILTEKDSFGIVDPTLNAVCLNAGRKSRYRPLADQPATAPAALQPNPSFVPLLACYDLTRTAHCPLPMAARNQPAACIHYYGHADIQELALYLQDTITLKNWTFNLGVRGDLYNGITRASQAEPRLGIAYNIKPTNTVLRVSYARTLETPFNENLVLASLGCNDAVINALSAPFRAILASQRR